VRGSTSNRSSRLRAALDTTWFIAGMATCFVQCLCEGFGQGLTATPLYEHWLPTSWPEWCYYLAIAHAPGCAGLLSIEALLLSVFREAPSCSRVVSVSRSTGGGFLSEASSKTPWNVTIPSAVAYTHTSLHTCSWWDYVLLHSLESNSQEPYGWPWPGVQLLPCP
jgi:hypothetical protein